MALVVLPRGVKVGGHRTFRPAELAKEPDDLDVVNIGAAGIFVIRQPVTQRRLRAEPACRLPFEAAIMIGRGQDIQGPMSHRNVAGRPARPDFVRFVSVLSVKPHSAPSPPVSLPASGERLVKVPAREQRFAFGLYRRRTKVIGRLRSFDRLMGLPVAMRDRKTIAAIAKLPDNGAIDRRGKRRREQAPSYPSGRRERGSEKESRVAFHIRTS